MNNSNFEFPPVESATPEGLLAVGGNLSSKQLLKAYRRGIFPWYNADQPVLWWSPDPRLALFPEDLIISRSLKKILKKEPFRITLDQCFKDVLQGCAAPRQTRDEPGTWITHDMIEAYQRLHELGYAHSVETWQDDTLVGGLYGVSIGGCFFGESMFSTVSNASKTAFIHLVQQLQRWGFALIDCQVTTSHLVSLGAVEISRSDFLEKLELCLEQQDKIGLWQFDNDFVLNL
ncbi:MAG: leucyl/phenylalanyl-tRNA--protein transferase [Gammaproteobacteria bacterium]|nr:MAG: leucyl/phenylalanyl-tRNA--protein transferase [Gammaproteobacteria bacterium]